ncbi:hypothetical protein RhiXN_04490 [Rhizoctonia solani]|uniref:Uncharacterized protein n=1 Tax=Rhizoctonia solani TaxID=456999 RepID=A0A8H8NML9_9AGAM|nr:uncharacterized protein RhiXN_04490 [Rhizoctonia solani]QRW16489.1 hypothetical protein RhiXN_04490 [Rhizoctonia solani]
MSDAWSDLDEEISSHDDEAEIAPSGAAPTRRSTRLKNAVDIDRPNVQDQSVPVIKSEPDDAAGLENLLTISGRRNPGSIISKYKSPHDNLVVEPEEEKPKQELRLTYTGYMVPSRCLCVIAEPWPDLPSPAQLASQATKHNSKTVASTSLPSHLF